MAAAVQYDGLRAAQHQAGAHRRGQGGDAAQMAGEMQNWAGLAAASASAKSQKQQAIVQGSYGLAETGVAAQGRLGEQALATTAQITNAAMNNAVSAFNSKTSADAQVKQAKLAYGDSPLDYMRFAGGLGVLAYGMGDSDLG